MTFDLGFLTPAAAALALTSAFLAPRVGSLIPRGLLIALALGSAIVVVDQVAPALAGAGDAGARIFPRFNLF